METLQERLRGYDPRMLVARGWYDEVDQTVIDIIDAADALDAKDAEIERLTRERDEARVHAAVQHLGLKIANEDQAEIERLTRERDEAQSACTAWQQVFGGIEAHLMDRVAMNDPAKPQTYLNIIRFDVADIDRSSKAIVDSRWADVRRSTIALEAAQAEIERLKEALRPFATYMANGGDLDNRGNPMPDEQGVGWVYLTHADFRRARAALAGEQ